MCGPLELVDEEKLRPVFKVLDKDEADTKREISKEIKKAESIRRLEDQPTAGSSGARGWQRANAQKKRKRKRRKS